LVKRLVGNSPPGERRPGVYLDRLLFDRDTVAKPAAPGVRGES